MLGQERDASRSFLDHVLREGKDKAFVIRFAREVELLQELTSSRTKLQSAIDKIDSPEFSQSGSGGNTQGGSGGGVAAAMAEVPEGAVRCFDAVFLASDELMKEQQGRKALIVLTDGVDHGSKETVRKPLRQRSVPTRWSIASCLPTRTRTEVVEVLAGPTWVVWGVAGGRAATEEDIRGAPIEAHPDGKKVLQQMSQATGGRFFEILKRIRSDKIYAAIDEELRGFNTTWDSRHRKMTARLAITSYIWQ